MPNESQQTHIPKPASEPSPAVSPEANTSRGNFRHPERGISYNQGVLIIILLLVGLGFPLMVLLKPEVKPVDKWEYRIESPTDETLAHTINELGAQGWELVFARRATSGGEYFPSVHYEMIFKKPAK